MSSLTTKGSVTNMVARAIPAGGRDQGSGKLTGWVWSTSRVTLPEQGHEAFACSHAQPTCKGEDHVDACLLQERAEPAVAAVQEREHEARDDGGDGEGQVEEREQEDLGAGVEEEEGWAEEWEEQREGARGCKEV